MNHSSKKQIQSLRKKIDGLDNKLINILEKRITTANKIILIKQKQNIKIENKKRESQVINCLKKTKKVNSKLIEKIYKVIFQHMKSGKN
tara:strand:- start:462 stop:728 length:267 start_codon:yes stop_codon:yes gene_type:complete